MAALTIQALLAARTHLDVASTLLVSMIASIAGLAGGKIYYYLQHRGEPLSLLTMGMCIQGFVIAAVAVIAAGGLPAGQLLDVTAPGLLAAMAIGRLGCFLGGCCAGHPTCSRWGMWSSDRRLGARRIPAQLLESALALALRFAALLTDLATRPSPPGGVFIGAIAAYTLGRQLLFPLRSIPRKTSRGRMLTMIAAGLVVAADILVAVLA